MRMVKICDCRLTLSKQISPGSQSPPVCCSSSSHDKSLSQCWLTRLNVFLFFFLFLAGLLFSLVCIELSAVLSRSSSLSYFSSSSLLYLRNRFVWAGDMYRTTVSAAFCSLMTFSSSLAYWASHVIKMACFTLLLFFSFSSTKLRLFKTLASL